MNTDEQIPASFRDPSGFLFQRDGLFYRQVNRTYQGHFDRLMASGLYAELTGKGLLIPHHEVAIKAARPETSYKIIQPEKIEFISYPYEWCFSQLKDAALLTLQIQQKALDFGMSLKDGSAYNIQFQSGRPVFIDTLSFEMYREGQPWIAYRQFCQHFLAPLALMSHRDVRLSQLLRIYIDGVPLDLASSLLPFRTRFQLALLSHVHLHARSQKRYEDKKVDPGKIKLSRLALSGLINNLKSSVQKLNWRPRDTQWANYDPELSYSRESLEHKKQIVSEFIDGVHPTDVWDLGSNNGVFSRLAAEKGIPTVSFDNDSAAVEKNYLSCRGKRENILPLVVDLTNPSPGLGWQNQERQSLIARGPVDTVLVLALIHHLGIGNNVPLGKLAEFFHQIGNALVIEFIPKTDRQVQRLLATREDIFPDYKQSAFESEFGHYFNIQRSVKIKDSERTLYLMRKLSR